MAKGTATLLNATGVPTAIAAIAADVAALELPELLELPKSWPLKQQRSIACPHR